MSLIKDRIKKRKENKIQARADALAAETGIYFSPEITSDDKGFPLLKYIVNALVLFGATYGSVSSLVTAFELKVTLVPLVTTCIVASLILSFMYTSHRLKIFTYLSILVGVIMLAFGGFAVVNSGISALRNNILKYIDDKVDLPFLREFNLYFKDEYTAMSIALCVIAIFLMILMNILVSEKMSLRGIFALTFPLIQFGMYFNFHTSKFSMLCVLSSWVLVAAVNMTNGYDGLTRKMESKSKVKNHKHTYGFITDSKNVANIAVVFLSAIFIVSGFVFSIVPNDDFELNLPTNSIKTSTERVVKNTLSYGMSSLWSRENSGNEPGSLSNVSKIYFDGKTDLKITVVNYNETRMYLKNYTGYYYNSQALRWDCKVDSEDTDFDNYTASVLQNDYENGKIICGSKRKVGIKIVDYALAEYFLNVPYYSVIDNENYSYGNGGINPNWNSENSANNYQYFTFYTVDKTSNDYSVIVNDNPELTEAEGKMKEDAYTNALDVPQINLEAVKKFCLAYGIEKGDPNAVNKVLSALENDFEYTLEPGKVPYGEDYVNYFLLGNQKGYCQHFASAATLIFRYLGIPARYCEGYVVDNTDFIDSVPLYDENVDEWVDSLYRHRNYVSEVSIPDYNGHAWVEIWKDGIGWVVVEATTASPASESRGLIADIFGGTNPLTSIPNGMIQSVKSMNINNTQAKLAILGLAFLFVGIAFYSIRGVLILLRRYNSFETNDNKINTSNRWNHLLTVYKYAYKDSRNLSYSELSDLLYEKGFIDKNPDEFREGIEEIIFSGETPDEGVYKEYARSIRHALRKIFADMRLLKKLDYIFVKIMW